MATSVEAYNLFPSGILDHNKDAADRITDLIILNSTLPDLGLLSAIWKCSRMRVCADGGANRLYDLNDDVARKVTLPNCIIGDLDSIRNNVRTFYSDLGVAVIDQSDDQDSTDLAKSLAWLDVQQSNCPTQPEQRDVVVVGSLSGRVDQALAILHQLLRHHLDYPHVQVWFVTDSSITAVLPTGMNIVHVDSESFGHHVGLIPLFGPCVISTKGLKWDVSDWKTQMGSQISSSNHVVDKTIAVSTDNPILFTIELRGDMREKGVGSAAR